MGPLRSFMVKSYLAWWWVVAYRILVSAPVPMGLIRVLNWVELVWGWTWGGLKTKGLVTGLDN